MNGSQIVTLLRSEHAQLASGFVLEASQAIENYSQRFGPIETGVIGIVEIQCRDSSYNWASEGIADVGNAENPKYGRPLTARSGHQNHDENVALTKTVINCQMWILFFGLGTRLTRPRLPKCRSFNWATISSTALVTALRPPCRQP